MKTRLLSLATLLVVLALATSCNDSKMSGILQTVPDDVDYVVVGNAETIVESLGGSLEGSQLKLPSFIMDELSEGDAKGIEEINKTLKDCGVNFDACVLTGYFERRDPVVVLSLNDVDMFKKAVEREEFKEETAEEDIALYKKTVFESTYDPEFSRYNYIAIKDSYAYILNNVRNREEGKPIEILKQFMAKAAKKPYASTEFSSYIASGNAGGVSIRIPEWLRNRLANNGTPSKLLSIYDGVVCMKGDLSANKMEVRVKLFDNNGKQKTTEAFKEFMDMDAKVSSKALAYLGKDEALVYAASLKNVDWDSYFDVVSEVARMSRSDKAVLNAAASYMSKIDGTVAFGFGLSNGLKSFIASMNSSPSLNELAMTMVCETKEGKAKSLIGDMKGLMEAQHLQYEDKENGFACQIPYLNGTIYAEATDDILVISNRPVSNDNSNETVKAVDFTDYIATMALVLTKNSQVIKDLGLDSDVKLVSSMDAKDSEAILKIEIDNNESVGIIGKFTKLVLATVKNGKSLTR